MCRQGNGVVVMGPLKRSEDMGQTPGVYVVAYPPHVSRDEVDRRERRAARTSRSWL